MKRTTVGAALGAILLFGAISQFAAADDAPPPPPPATTSTNQPSDNLAQTPPAETPEDQKIVCRKEPPPVGSRMGGKKICHTVAEWRRIEAAARETTSEIQSRKHEPEGQ